MTNLGNHFKKARLAAGLSLLDLARMTHYGRPKKTARRIAHFERGGGISDELLARLADALAVDLPTVERLMDQDGHDDHLTVQEIAALLDGLNDNKPLAWPVLDALESAYATLSHSPACPTRYGGECLCLRSRVADALADAGRDGL